MAEPEHEESHGEKPDAKHGDKPAGVPDKKKDSKKQTIIAAASILGIIIAFLTFKKSSGGGGAATGLPAGGSIGAYTPAGNVAGAADNSSAFAGLQTMLGNQSLQLQQLESALSGLTPSGSSAATPAVTPPAFQFGSAEGGDLYLADYTNAHNGIGGTIYQEQATPSGGLAQVAISPQQWALVGQQAATQGRVRVLGSPTTP